MIYGYVRIRKNLEASEQEKILQKYSEFLQKCGVDKIVVETSGSSQLQDMLDCLIPGDSIHVVALEHLTRSLARMAEISRYFKKNNISLYAMNQPINHSSFLIANQIAQLSKGYDEEYDEESE